MWKRNNNPESQKNFRATALSAEITFGSWGRALWVTAANASVENGVNTDGTKKYYDTIVTDVHQSWGGAAPRTALGVSGNSDNVGFVLDIHSNGTSLGQGDNALIWVKPIDMVKLSVGKHDQNVLRSDAAFGLWNWDRLGPAGTAGEGFIFADYLDVQGVDAVITPNENLTIGVGVPLSLDGSHGATTTKDADGKTESDPYVIGSISDAWLNSAIVAAYKLDNVGTAKVGLKLNTLEERGSYKSLGDNPTTENGDWKYYTGLYANQSTDKEGKYVKTWCQIAAAFELTSVENLYASLGAKINTLNTKGHEVNAYAKYSVNEQLAIHGVVGTKISTLDSKEFDEGKKAKKDCYNGFGFLAGAGVDYALDGGIGIFADVRYANGVYHSGSSADNKDCFVLGAGVTKGFSNGVIGVAFEGATNSNGRYGYKDAKQFAWEIPVKFEYWF